MELFQSSWDDQKKLFLEFKKSDDDQDLLSDKITRLTIKYVISRTLKQEFGYRTQPTLISVKEIYTADDLLSFAIDLDEISLTDDLQFKILRLTFFLFSGQKIEYQISDSVNISDIWVNEDCYSGYELIDLNTTTSIKKTSIKERIVKEVKKDLAKNKEESTILYERKHYEEITQDGSLLGMIKETNRTLKNIESLLQNLASTMQNLPLHSIASLPQVPMRSQSQGPGIERIRKQSSRPQLIHGQSSAKLLVIKEMKTIFQENIDENNGFSVKNILKPMSEEELAEIMINDDVLAEKEETAIKNQIARLKKDEEKEVNLANLKKPI